MQLRVDINDLCDEPGTPVVNERRGSDYIGTRHHPKQTAARVSHSLNR